LSDSGTRNLLIFTTVSSVWAIVLGFIGPFYVLQVERLSGGMEKLGIAFSITVLVQSASTYFAGRFSDRLGRKPFLFLTAYVDAAVLFLYTVIQETYQLYILQALLGVTNGIVGTITTSILGDMTIREKRGAMVGKFNAVVSIAAAAGLALGGFLVKIYGLQSLFYLASVIVALSTSLLFFIREDPLMKTGSQPSAD
jgi:DHA1 family multidrug resistance protein-like MFS transporter